MPRPREFDEQQALDAAMTAFWATGYEATSTQDLCEATGLGRSSIYNTFSSKHELYRRSLQRYHETATGNQLEVLAAEGDPREKIRALLTQAAHDDRGCLAVNASIELGSRDSEVKAVLRKGFDQLIEAIRATVQEGQRAGVITREKDALALAQFVHGTIGGLRVLSSSGASTETLCSVVDIAMSAL
ncbi:TetR/AcrR family transcriptional regulator [Kutzneria viridogrisea]|uniref:HTH tetR-type domain-containing protein n=2 Tax=Kutzneria TaxID=43356 RepID=W5WCR3_9PSEU|nr:TetR/AcrR family transcriptional regulator [Kutzneria albida]AHH96009.1 hypothetical protein KALB_2641 [Kutzneria albida DSM 43870]MBA8928789.1 AcrR family transcriptional regulator [Kutzneria viridogrisea]